MRSCGKRYRWTDTNSRVVHVSGSGALPDSVVGAPPMPAIQADAPPSVVPETPMPSAQTPAYSAARALSYAALIVLMGVVAFRAWVAQGGAAVVVLVGLPAAMVLGDARHRGCRTSCTRSRPLPWDPPGCSS